MHGPPAVFDVRLTPAALALLLELDAAVAYPRRVLDAAIRAVCAQQTGLPERWTAELDAAASVLRVTETAE